MANGRATLRDVARAAQVSTGTASQAFNGSPLVRQETRARVLEVAQRLGYVPDRNAVRLLQGRTECLGVAFAKPNAVISGATFYALVVRGIMETAEEAGYSVRLVRLIDEHTQTTPAPKARRPVSARDVDGLLVLDWMDSVMIARLRQVGVPLVAVDSSGGYPDLLAVDSDDRDGVLTAVSHLIALGHRQIAFLNVSLTTPFGHAALDGYLQAFARAQLPVPPWLFCTTEISIGAGHRAITELLSAGQVPTGVFAVTDEQAVGAIQAIQEAGLRVPEDVSVVGVGDIPLAPEVRPGLTTVHVDMEGLGRQATHLLLRAISGEQLESSSLVLPTRLVIRKSTAPPRSP